MPDPNFSSTQSAAPMCLGQDADFAELNVIAKIAVPTGVKQSLCFYEPARSIMSTIIVGVVFRRDHKPEPLWNSLETAKSLFGDT